MDWRPLSLRGESSGRGCDLGVSGLSAGEPEDLQRELGIEPVLLPLQSESRVLLYALEPITHGLVVHEQALGGASTSHGWSS